MNTGSLLYHAIQPAGPELRLEHLPYDTPRGNRVRLSIGAARIGLLEGHARRLHLEILDWLYGRAKTADLYQVDEVGAPRLILRARADRRLQITLGTETFLLLEGSARRLHLELRNWVRQQKALRGDTPRGRRRLLARAKEIGDAAAGR